MSSYTAPSNKGMFSGTNTTSETLVLYFTNQLFKLQRAGAPVYCSEHCLTAVLSKEDFFFFVTKTWAEK